jgi:hypothetical protein
MRIFSWKKVFSLGEKKEDEWGSKKVVYPPTMITSFTDLIASNGNTKWPTSSR